jgi:hypothetical protein
VRRHVSLTGPQTGQGLLLPSRTASQGLLFFQDPTAIGPSTPPSNILTTGASNNNSTVTPNGSVDTPKRYGSRSPVAKLGDG